MSVVRCEAPFVNQETVAQAPAAYSNKRIFGSCLLCSAILPIST